MSNIKETIWTKWQHWREEKRQLAEERKVLDGLHAHCMEFLLQHGKPSTEKGINLLSLTFPDNSLQIIATALYSEVLPEYANYDNRLQFEHLSMNYEQPTSDGIRIQSYVNPYNGFIHKFKMQQGDKVIHNYKCEGPEFSHEGLKNITKEYHTFLEQTVMPKLTDYEESLQYLPQQTTLA